MNVKQQLRHDHYLLKKVGNNLKQISSNHSDSWIVVCFVIPKDYYIANQKHYYIADRTISTEETVGGNSNSVLGYTKYIVNPYTYSEVFNPCAACHMKQTTAVELVKRWVNDFDTPTAMSLDEFRKEFDPH